MVKLLVEKGASVNALDSSKSQLLHALYKANSSPDGASVFHKAAACGERGFETAKFLLENGADHSIVDHFGVSPFHAACFSGCSSLVKHYLDEVSRKDSQFLFHFHLNLIFLIWK